MNLREMWCEGWGW